MPRDFRRNRTSTEDGEHVPDAIGIFWMLVEHVEESWIESGVEYAGEGFIIEHSLVPEYVDHRRRLRRRVCHYDRKRFDEFS